jgi:PEP-CTERM motif
MKRKVLASVLGAAGLLGLAASSYGQGQIIFDNYGASPYYAVVYSAASQAALGLSSAGALGNVSVELGYALGANQTTGFTLIPSTITAINPALSQADAGGVGPVTTGWFQGPLALIPTVGPVTYEILGWVASGNGAGGGTYSTSLYNGSALFTELTVGSIANPANNFTGMNGDIILNPVSVPEPTTLALAGLGLASLVALRRKQS